MSHPQFTHIVDAAQSRTTGQIDPFTVAYITHGGTWVVASDGRGNDDGADHDLLAVIPASVEGTRVLPLRVTVNPDLVNFLREALDGPGARSAEADG